MAEATELIAALQPVLERLRTVDLRSGADPTTLAAGLDVDLPVDGPILGMVRTLVELGLDEGWLCPKEAGGVRFGRLAKASPATHGFSIDTVDMRGPGPGHTHPQGEIDLCFPLDGQPTFDGRAAGWTVYGPGSWHVPTVAGGRMAILYFLPGGEIRFEPKP
ncbi:DUF4863 family protein [Myxococcota bacterium]|nr:DUF4863 family protein [Myxococcota bacterium]